jgi:D-alanyl-D-alanine dipeptidase
MKIYWLIIIFFFISCNYSPKEKSLAKELLSTKEKVLLKEDTITEYEQAVVLVYDYDTSKWSDIGILDSTIILDLKYATTDNFVEEKMYDCGRCFLRKKAAAQLLLIQEDLQQKGYGLKMFDCYRPRPVQWKLWEKVPNPKYVADPKKGSMHNRGAAVDLTIVDNNGNDFEMGTHYDFFGPRAHSTFTSLPDSIMQNRQLLSSTMMKYGFHPIRSEWWHFSWKGENYPLSDMLWECDE